jgi:hypothetical protein
MKMHGSLVGLSLAGAVTVVAWGGTADAATVSFSPQPASVAAGQTTTLSLSGSGFTQTTEGGGVNVNFDPSRVHVTNVSVDATTWEFFTSVGAIDNVNGVVHDLVFASFAGRSGSFPIATITFQGVGPGTSPLTMTESTLNPFASGGQHLAVTLSAGALTVPAAPVPVGPGAMAAIALGLALVGARLAGRRGSRGSGASGLALAALAALSVLGAARSARAATDTDRDGAPDVLDNCITFANPDQLDTDNDGFGNRCDPDLNNDGIVNSLDLGIFKAAFATSNNPNADFNGDGITNSLDLGLLKPFFLQAPGPTGVILSTALASDPPPCSQVDAFTLDRTLPDGSNGAAFYHFGASQKLAPAASLGSVVSMVLGRVRPFNDLGLEPDQVAGDGIFSGFVTLNADSILSNEQAFIGRLPARPVTTSFSGRDVTGTATFTVPSPAQSPRITLPSGIVLSPVGMRFFGTPTLPFTGDAARSLTITAKSVVADKTRTFDPCDVDGGASTGSVNGVWSFKTLMANMANTPVTGIPLATFINNWLLNWMSAQTVGGSPYTIPPRPTMIKSFFPGWDGLTPGTLDVDHLPFRLLAIVNRMDLAGASLYGTPANARKSETRFVFGLVAQGTPGCAVPGSLSAARRMTVIFEYGDPVSNCTDLQTRAQAWIALSSIALGTAAYNTALQALTDGVTAANAGAPFGKPNGSALDQLRTNEIALSAPWQLREFGLALPFSSLQSATIKQTPDPFSFRFTTAPLTAVTALFWQTNVDPILCESHVVPGTFMGTPFLGTHTEYGTGQFWDATTTIAGMMGPPGSPGQPACWQSNVSSVTLPTKAGEVRHKFSINTCDDCHSGETNTSFTHVDPLTSPAALSGFLTGAAPANPVNDPGGEPVQRSFNDLQRRGQDLENFAMGCFVLPIARATVAEGHLTLASH